MTNVKKYSNTELIEFLDRELEIEIEDARSYGGGKGDAFEERMAILTEIKQRLESQKEQQPQSLDEELVERVMQIGETMGGMDINEHDKELWKHRELGKAEICKLLQQAKPKCVHHKQKQALPPDDELVRNLVWVIEQCRQSMTKDEAVAEIRKILQGIKNET